MWICVDRIEGDTVVLTDDREQVYRLPAADYTVLTGRSPRESDLLEAVAEGNRILAARYSEEETLRRRELARARLNRLFGRK